jgi:hypothetical protein
MLTNLSSSPSKHHPLLSTGASRKRERLWIKAFPARVAEGEGLDNMNVPSSTSTQQLSLPEKQS